MNIDYLIPNGTGNRSLFCIIGNTDVKYLSHILTYLGYYFMSTNLVLPLKVTLSTEQYSDWTVDINLWNWIIVCSKIGHYPKGNYSEDYGSSLFAILSYLPTEVPLFMKRYTEVFQLKYF